MKRCVARHSEIKLLCSSLTDLAADGKTGNHPAFGRSREAGVDAAQGLLTAGERTPKSKATAEQGEEG